MADNAIEELFYKLNAGLDYTDINPNGTKEYSKVCNENNKEIGKVIGEESFINIEDFIGAQSAAAEQYGFVTGFKYAMRLMLACGGNNSVSSGETNS